MCSIHRTAGKSARSGQHLGRRLPGRARAGGCRRTAASRKTRPRRRRFRPRREAAQAARRRPLPSAPSAGRGADSGRPRAEGPHLPPSTSTTAPERAKPRRAGRRNGAWSTIKRHAERQVSRDLTVATAAALRKRKQVAVGLWRKRFRYLGRSRGPESLCGGQRSLHLRGSLRGRCRRGGGAGGRAVWPAWRGGLRGGLDCGGTGSPYCRASASCVRTGEAPRGSRSSARRDAQVSSVTCVRSSVVNLLELRRGKQPAAVGLPQVRPRSSRPASRRALFAVRRRGQSAVGFRVNKSVPFGAALKCRSIVFNRRDYVLMKLLMLELPCWF